MGVLIVTHNFGVVADLCDRVSVMQRRPDRRDRAGAVDLRRPAPRVHPVAVRRDPRGQQASRALHAPAHTRTSGAPSPATRPSGAARHERAACSTSTTSSSNTPGKGFRAKPFRALQGRLPRHPPRRDRRPGRRVRVGQDHAGPGRARPGTGHRGRDQVRRPRHQPPVAHGASGAVQLTSAWSSRTPTRR